MRNKSFHMFGKTPEWASHLRTFGEAGTVKIKTDTTPKLHDRGVQCMFVGYAENHRGVSTECGTLKQEKYTSLVM
jgi:hypothetical protein